MKPVFLQHNLVSGYNKGVPHTCSSHIPTDCQHCFCFLLTLRHLRREPDGSISKEQQKPAFCFCMGIWPIVGLWRFLSYYSELFSASMFWTVITSRTIINLQDLYIINSTSSWSIYHVVHVFLQVTNTYLGSSYFYTFFHPSHPLLPTTPMFNLIKNIF